MTTAPKTGMFYVDAPERNASALEVDPKRIFYREDPTNLGGMKMNWIDYQVNLDAKHVTVIYPHGYHVVLSNIDAYKFLRIVRDKNTNAFARR
jgi:hypothetical protein